MALLVTAKLMPGVYVEGLYVALITAFILGLLNAVVRPIFIFLTLPITLVTLGLFIFIINGAIFWFTASFVDGFDVASFWTAVIASVVVSIISTVTNWFVK